MPYHITLAKIEDEKEAEELLKWLKDLINETYEQTRARSNLTIPWQQISRHSIIFKLLPGTNCKKCGEPTCLAFAVKLAGQEARDYQM